MRTKGCAYVLGMYSLLKEIEKDTETGKCYKEFTVCSTLYSRKVIYSARL